MFSEVEDNYRYNSYTKERESVCVWVSAAVRRGPAVSAVMCQWLATEMLTYFGQTNDYDPERDDVRRGHVLEVELSHLISLNSLVLIVNQVDVLVRRSDAVQCGCDAFFIRCW